MHRFMNHLDELAGLDIVMSRRVAPRSSVARLATLPLLAVLTGRRRVVAQDRPAAVAPVAELERP